MIVTAGTLESTGLNNTGSLGTTKANVTDLGMNSMTANADMDVVSQSGTLAGSGPNKSANFNYGMENAINASNDTTMMDVSEGTVESGGLNG